MFAGILSNIQLVKRSKTTKRTAFEEPHHSPERSNWWSHAAFLTALNDPGKAVNIASLCNWWESNHR